MSGSLKIVVADDETDTREYLQEYLASLGHEVKAYVVTDEAKRVADFSAKSVNFTWLFLPDSRDQLKKNRPDAKSAETQGISAYVYLRTHDNPEGHPCPGATATIDPPPVPSCPNERTKP